MDKEKNYQKKYTETNIYLIKPTFIIDFRTYDFQGFCKYNNQEFWVVLNLKNIENKYNYPEIALLLMNKLNDEITQYKLSL